MGLFSKIFGKSDDAKPLLERRGGRVVLVVEPSLTVAKVIAYELARSFSTDAFRACPVILLHGAFEHVDADRARAAGVSDIIAKPFESTQLVAAIERAIGMKPQ